MGCSYVDVYTEYNFESYFIISNDQNKSSYSIRPVKDISLKERKGLFIKKALEN